MLLVPMLAGEYGHAWSETMWNHVNKYSTPTCIVSCGGEAAGWSTLLLRNLNKFERAQKRQAKCARFMYSIYSTATSRNLLVYLLVLAAAVVVWIGRGNPRQFKVVLRLSQDWHFFLRYSGICQHGFKLVLAQRMQEAFTKGRTNALSSPIYPLATLVAAFPLNDARWWNNAVVDKLGLNAKISASLVSCKKISRAFL